MLFRARIDGKIVRRHRIRRAAEPRIIADDSKSDDDGDAKNGGHGAALS